MEKHKTTKLVKLPIIGLGTAYIESLNSLIQRTANCHGINVSEIFNRFIYPNYPKKQVGNSNLYNQSRSNVSSRQQISSLVQIFEELTNHNNLLRITFYELSNIFSCRRLTREVKYWDPLFYAIKEERKEEIYDPLIWYIPDYKYSSISGSRLVSKCHHCYSEQHYISNTSMIGYCQKCGKSLGSFDYPYNNLANPHSKELTSYHRWCSIQVDKFIGELENNYQKKVNGDKQKAFNNDTFSQNNFYDNFAKLKDHHTKKMSYYDFQSLTNVSHCSANNYLHRIQEPSMTVALMIAYTLDIELIKLFKLMNSIQNCLFIKQLPPGYDPMKIHKKRCINANKVIKPIVLRYINRQEYKKFSITTYAKNNGYSADTIRRYYPSEYNIAKSLFVKFKKAENKRRQKKAIEEIKDALRKLMKRESNKRITMADIKAIRNKESLFAESRCREYYKRLRKFQVI